MGTGVNKLVSELDRELFDVKELYPIDRFSHSWGILETRFVRVTRHGTAQVRNL